jgi:hypothetical protein
MFFGGDPFEHFAHASRGGGGSHGGRRPGASNADTTKLYETLGVRSSCRKKHGGSNCVLKGGRLMVDVCRHFCCFGFCGMGRGP